jgi:hypothetical protein
VGGRARPAACRKVLFGAAKLKAMFLRSWTRSETKSAVLERYSALALRLQAWTARRGEASNLFFSFPLRLIPAPSAADKNKISARGRSIQAGCPPGRLLGQRRSGTLRTKNSSLALGHGL